MSETQTQEEVNGAVRKLDHDQKREVVVMLAFGYSPEFVAKELLKRYEITIRPNTIRKTYLHGKRWRKYLERLRNKLDSEVMKHPLASKVNRLDILNTAIQKVLNDEETNNHGSLPSLIKEARAEIEGDKDTTPQLLQKITIINSTAKGDKKAKDFDSVLSGEKSVPENRIAEEVK